MRRNRASRRVAVAVDINGCAVAVEFSACIHLTSLYIIRYGISIRAEALVPSEHGLVAVEREAKLAARERLVGKPVAVRSLMSCALVVEGREVITIGHRQRAGFIADELGVVAELCKVGANDFADVHAVRYGAASLVNPRAESRGRITCNLTCVEAVLELNGGISTLPCADDAACTLDCCCDGCFVDAVLDNERRAAVGLYSTSNAANEVGAGYFAAAVDDEVADDRCAAHDAEEALVGTSAVDNHVLDAMASTVESAVVLESGVEADGRMCVDYAFIVNVGSQEAVDGCQMSIVDHSGEPLHICCAAKLVEAIGIGRDVVLHELSADGAPSVDIVMLGSRCVIRVAVGHVAQGNAGAVHFAHGIDLFVAFREGQWESILSQRLIPVDAALVTICLEAKFACFHHVVGDVGATAGS